MQIIVKNNKPLSPLLNGEYIDPEFLKMDRLSLQDSLHCPPNVIADKLAHQITRSPNDLRSHTQRIVIFIEQHKAPALYSSLIDLFLVLGEKGVSLRKRMLLSARHILSEHQFKLLWKSLISGFNIDVASIEAGQSILRRGSKSTPPFIQKMRSSSKPSIDSSQQVRSYLEYGQIDEARLLLQESILDDPQEIAYHQDLVDIFHKLADKTLFISFYDQLLKRDMEPPSIWHQLAEEFNYEHSK